MRAQRHAGYDGIDGESGIDVVANLVLVRGTGRHCACS